MFTREESGSKVVLKLLLTTKTSIQPEMIRAEGESLIETYDGAVDSSNFLALGAARRGLDKHKVKL
jgi:hypothetical protein